MTNLVPIVLLIGVAVILQMLDKRISVGGIQTHVTWFVGVVSVFLVLGAGTYALGLVGPLLGWIESFGTWGVLALGLLGVAGVLAVVLTVIPQRWSSSSSSGAVLLLAFLLPALLPYVRNTIGMALAYLPAAAANIQGAVTR